MEHTKIIQADSGRQGANDSQNNAYFSSLPTTNSDLNFATSISNLYSNQFNLLLKNRRCRSNQPTSLAYIKRKQYFSFLRNRDYSFQLVAFILVFRYWAGTTLSPQRNYSFLTSKIQQIGAETDDEGNQVEFLVPEDRVEWDISFAGGEQTAGFLTAVPKFIPRTKINHLYFSAKSILSSLPKSIDC